MLTVYEYVVVLFKCFLLHNVIRSTYVKGDYVRCKWNLSTTVIASWFLIADFWLPSSLFFLRGNMSISHNLSIGICCNDLFCIPPLGPLQRVGNQRAKTRVNYSHCWFKNRSRFLWNYSVIYTRTDPCLDLCISLWVGAYMKW